MKNEKKDLWDLMYPNAEQLLKEALAKTDEEVAESLRAKGYDLDVLDQQLIGLINRLPPYKAPAKKKGFIAIKVAGAVGALGTVGTGIYTYLAATAAPAVAVTAMAGAAATLSPPGPGPAPQEQTVQVDVADAGREGGKR